MQKCIDTCILVTKKDKKSLQRTTLKYKKLLQAIKKDSKRDEAKFYSNNIKSAAALSKTMMRNCTRKICNPGCKNTIFERKWQKKAVDELLESGYRSPADLKKMKAFLLETAKYDRKMLFGRKKNVLKDGFYEKIDPERVERLKKMGAISGCLTNRGDNRLGLTQPYS